MPQTGLTNRPCAPAAGVAGAVDGGAEGATPPTAPGAGTPAQQREDADDRDERDLARRAGAVFGPYGRDPARATRSGGSPRWRIASRNRSALRRLAIIRTCGASLR